MRQADPRSKTRYISAIYNAFMENELSLKRFLRRFLFKPEDIDEITQETFLRAYKATNNRVVDSPKAYLFQVARSLAYTELSRKNRKLTDYLEEAVEDSSESTPSLEDEIAAQQKLKHFLDAIATLPPRCRRVYMMRKVQAMSYKEIAEALDISVSGVEQHLVLGSERCKKYIESKYKMSDEATPRASVFKVQNTHGGKAHD